MGHDHNTNINARRARDRLGPVQLTIEGNYERLMRLMGRPDDEQVSVVEIPPIPMAK